MGRSSDADAYLPCLKCKALVPQYVKEVHATECHTLKLSKFSHPLISGLSLLGQAIIIGNQDLPSKKSTVKNKSNQQNATKENNSSKVQKGDSSKEKGPKMSNLLDINSKSKVEEPEWLKKIIPGFHYRMVIINELDLIRCNITAYTPVLLEQAGISCAFVAIPDNSIRIGHVMLHRIGCMQYFPSLIPNALIWVKKIVHVNVAEQIVFSPRKPLSEEECTAMECHIKNIMLSSFPLGAPYTVMVNSVIFPHSLDMFGSDSFTVSSCIAQEECSYTMSEKGQLITKMKSLHIDSDSGKLSSQTSEISSQFITVDSCSVSEQSSLFDVSEQCQEGSSVASGGYITIDEYNDGDSYDEFNSSDKSFVTSTPHKKSSSSGSNLCKSLLMSKISENLSAKDVFAVDKIVPYINTWVRVGVNTKIIVERLNKNNPDVITQKAEKKDTYCKDSIYYILMKIMQNKLKHSKLLGNPFLSGWSGVLLYGPPGTGKTLLVSEIALAMNIPLVTLTLADVIGSSGGGSECVRRMFRLASERAPSVLFIDEIDSLCPAGEQRISRDKDLTRAVISGIQQLKTATDPVLLIAVTSRIEAVSAKLRCSGRFDKELLVPLPNAQQRFKILHNLMLSHIHSISQEDLVEIAKQAYGFSGADMNLLLKCAWFNCVQKTKENTGQRTNLCLYKEHLQVGMAGVVPTMLRQDFQAVSMVKWNDIWGYEALKSKLQMMINLHITQPEMYPLKGLLLYGPPGCSKTMFVKALVKETSFSFFPLKCSDLLSKYVGETEKSLSRIFSDAQAAAPSIIFMDEVDSLCSDRGGGSGLVSELLSIMSETVLLGNILVIGATNRPHVLDEALLKPGCLEQVVHVDLPDHDCRCEIWKGVLEDVPFGDQVSIEKLSDATAGYSGAEITGVYQQAAQAVITQFASRKENRPQNSDIDSVVMTEDIIFDTIKSAPPRTPVSLLKKIKEFSNRCTLPAR